MESNREESQKCLRIANAAFGSGNIEKAVKFISKSNKLYPLKEAEGLLKKIEELSAQSKSAKYGTFSTSGSQSMPDFSELHGSSAEAEPKYTPQQQQLVNKVNQAKDFYDILGVSKEASEAEMKKAYRKMALQLHPDKNSAPGATDAFKSVGKAYAILSDSEQRRRYDLYGPEEVQTRRRRRNSSDDEFDGEFDPNEFFNMFFGGGFPNENVRVFRQGNTYYYDRRHRRQQRTEHTQQGNPVMWIQILPILLIFLMSILGNLFVSDPAYSFHKKGDYLVQRHTGNLHIKYFVKRDFGDTYKRQSVSLQRLEDSIEGDYVENLRERCYQERVNKENLRRKGIYFGSSDMVKRAEVMTTPSCDKLEALFQRSQ